MRLQAALLSSVLAMGLVAAPTSADLKLGFVDLQKVLQTVDAGKKAKAQLEKEVTAKRTELEKKQKQLQSEAEQLEKRAAILNDAAKLEKQGELQKKFQEFQKTAMESQMALQQRERDLTNPILEQIRSVVEAVGKEKAFQLILEKNEGAVLYAANGADLTDEVIGNFNKKSKKS